MRGDITFNEKILIQYKTQKYFTLKKTQLNLSGNP